MEELGKKNNRKAVRRKRTEGNRSDYRFNFL